MAKQSQLLLKPTEVELGLQVGVEFDKIDSIRWVSQFDIFINQEASSLSISRESRLKSAVFSFSEQYYCDNIPPVYKTVTI